MSSAALYGYCGAILVGLGLYGVIARPELFGVFARRGAEAGLRADPVPQALVITGIVVAFSATALAVALLIRLNKDTGEVVIASDDSAESGKQGVRQ